MTTIPVKISAKSSTSTRNRKVWGIALAKDFIENTLGFVPRIKLSVDGDDLIVHLNEVLGVLMSSPSAAATSYYSSISALHITGITAPFDKADTVNTQGRFNKKQCTVRILAKDLPAFMTLAIKRYRDLANEVASHQPEHSPEEFARLVQEHRGGETIGDHEALEAAFAQVSDAEARKMAESLNRFLANRTDVRIKLVDGGIKLSRVVEQEVDL